MKWPSIDICDLGNLLVRIITIGYEKKGESIIVILKNKIDESIIYSLVIDSFYRKKQHRTVELLRENNVDRLNLICWTHPDSDHSYGIDAILSEFGDNQTKIITPISFWSDDYAIKAFQANPREVNFVKHLREINKHTKCSLTTIAVPVGGSALIDRVKIIAGIDEITCSIDAVSPFVSELKGLIDAHIADPHNVPAPTRNQTSVSTLITIGPYKMLFGADLPNDEIELMDEERICNLVFLKIPHHCSESSKRMLDYILPSSNMLACTTVYRSTKPGSELPHQHILLNYVDRCEIVGCTGSHPSHNYGTVTADFDLFGQKECYIKLDGSAKIVKK